MRTAQLATHIEEMEQERDKKKFEAEQMPERQKEVDALDKQLKFAHMPVRENKLACSSCHNVHGTQNVKLLKAGGSVSESCVSCHAEKRGPMLWEHAPVVENCSTCHDPHNRGNYGHMLRFSNQSSQLCLTCHIK